MPRATLLVLVGLAASIASADRSVAQSRPPNFIIILDHDPAEKFDVAKEHPAVVAEIERIAVAHTTAVKPAPTQLEQRISSDQTR